MQAVRQLLSTKVQPRNLTHILARSGLNKRVSFIFAQLKNIYKIKLKKRQEKVV